MQEQRHEHLPPREPRHHGQDALPGHYTQEDALDTAFEQAEESRQPVSLLSQTAPPSFGVGVAPGGRADAPQKQESVAAQAPETSKAAIAGHTASGLPQKAATPAGRAKVPLPQMFLARLADPCQTALPSSATAWIAAARAVAARAAAAAASATASPAPALSQFTCTPAVPLARCWRLRRPGRPGLREGLLALLSQFTTAPLKSANAPKSTLDLPLSLGADAGDSSPPAVCVASALHRPGRTGRKVEACPC
eukprot:CAMPEP_0180658704 /NCGR_PEP_ID=MMETSP1037_2-20121125/57153_1 /TAXON_ID=632150 /ORGANISM="Azadinium spinosum, Strain 3D9" /LENGTH=250 /DNA_ID=CAMNT_0022685623 /DNA_START=1014 /DNA_END=1767 /DNA_ORIENTATION=+